MNSLADNFPNISKEWHPTLNRTLTPSDVSYGSKKKVWWKCIKGHEWEAMIQNRALNDTGCPYCLGKVVTSNNCLAVTHPELAKEWHPTINGTLTPYDFKAGSHRKVWWKCDKAEDHVWEAIIKGRVRGDGCPCCRGLKIVHSNCLATTHPEISREWHPSKKAPLTPSEVVSGSGKKVWWKCDKADDHEWPARIVDRTEKQSRCPCCDGRKIVKSNCLVTTHPKLAKEWHPTKNGSLTPWKIGYGSHTKVWWKCRKAEDHEWIATVNGRSNVNNHSKGRKCPFCQGKKVAKSNCLETTHPELAKEWHPTKNAPLTPSEVVSGYGKIVWWKCKKGHEWQSPPHNRSKGLGCPYCANLRVDQNNCLATTHPEIAKEWHPIKNGELSPYNVVAGTDKKVWWICQNGHEWPANIYQRTGPAQSGCPRCYKKISREAKQLFEILRLKFPNLVVEGEEEDDFLHLEGWSGKFDAGILEHKILIEYDGSFYHRDKHEKDIKKQLHGVKQGFGVVRIRQSPLSKLSDNDIVVPNKFDARLYASLIATHIESFIKGQ